jgi:hypothetical protein
MAEPLRPHGVPGVAEDDLLAGTGGTRQVSDKLPTGRSDGSMFRYRQGIAALNQQALSSFLWPVADLIRGDYKQADCGKVILPFTKLCRCRKAWTASLPAAQGLEDLLLALRFWAIGRSPALCQIKLYCGQIEVELSVRNEKRRAWGRRGKARLVIFSLQVRSRSFVVLQEPANLKSGMENRDDDCRDCYIFHRMDLLYWCFWLLSWGGFGLDTRFFYRRNN